MSEQYRNQQEQMNTVRDYSRRQVEQQSQKQVNIFEAAGVGLLAAGIGKWLFGNRGS